MELGNTSLRRRSTLSRTLPRLQETSTKPNEPVVVRTGTAVSPPALAAGKQQYPSTIYNTAGLVRGLKSSLADTVNPHNLFSCDNRHVAFILPFLDHAFRHLGISTAASEFAFSPTHFGLNNRVMEILHHAVRRPMGGHSDVGKVNYGVVGMYLED
ncbi:hypothetical protein LTR36_008402 [Oleoguttula mirabilis]|uniref:Uncharacterized protein n=1 Tax=Oleoguttula mirabilis TaxID=1507867 RepID=A0AAV9J8I5_9PEZI|nr:hypothetical protein LTR36_008402 [Oleoguttula mirabilis]